MCHEHLAGRAAAVLLTAILWSALANQRVDAAPDQRQADLRTKKAELNLRLLRAGGLKPLTPQSIISALGAQVDPPKMVTEYRKEWTVRPSDLYAGGTIAQAGNWVIVEITPAAALQVSFEDVAGAMLKLPYYRENAQGHVGEDSVATRVFASDHMFLVPAGMLQVRIMTKVPKDAPNHDELARQEGHDSTLGINSGTMLVESILVTSEGPSRSTSSMLSLAERRKRPQAAPRSRR